MTNINDLFFDGHYKDIWRAIIPAQLTEREVRFMLEYFDLKPGDEVLDMMCGYGRHSLALAEKGIRVTAVDNLPEYITEIRDKALVSNLPVFPRLTNIIDYRPAGQYKLAICMGNSLNFFDAGDTAKLLQHWAVALEPGSHLLINSWSLAEIVIPQFVEKSEAEQGDLKIISHSKYLFHPTRVETETQMMDTAGRIETKTAIDYIFSVNEIELLLKEAGFLLREVYSIPGRKKFALGEPRAYIVAVRQ
ncbi:MAG TPA: class I SAM-dependent methyltransferase [Chitinophagaceae bacterium]|nr:class I SAM-dependent methyltransferase [Chitinophagaceae bacterium]